MAIYKIAEYKFDNTLYDLIPEFNEGFEYTYEDVMNGNVTTRTIYSDDLPTLMRFGDNSTTDKTGSLLEIIYLDTINLTTMDQMFRCCSNIISIDASKWDVSHVTSMRETFRYATNLTTLNLKGWNTSNVTDMSSMFQYDSNLIEIKGLEDFDTSKVISFSLDNYYGLFESCSSLTTLNLEGWDVSKATSVKYMFSECRNLESLNISNWNVDHLKNSDITALTGNSKLKFLTINDTTYKTVNTFISKLPTKTASAPGTLSVAGVDDISQVNITTANSKYWNVTDEYKVAEYKFNNTLYDLFPEFNEGYQYIYEDVVEGNVTTRTIYSNELPTRMTFGDANTTNRTNSLLEVNYLNTSKLITTESMFAFCRNVTRINSSDWDMSNVNISYWMFDGCESLTELDVSNWDTSNIRESEGMFCSCRSLTELDVNNWDTRNFKSTYYLFDTCHSLASLDLSNWDTSNVTNMSRMFYDCRSLLSIGDISDWDTSNVTDISKIFANCHNLKEVDVSNWDTSQVVDFTWLFTYCYSITSIKGMNKWDTSNVTCFDSMFYSCDDLISLDLSGWDTSQVTDMGWMFCYCNKLEELNISNWTINNEIYIDGIFDVSPGLSTVIMNNSDYNSVNKIISELPTRTADNKGILSIVGIDDYFEVNINNANSKNWVIAQYEVTKYKFNNTLYDLIPSFDDIFANDPYYYACEDIVEGDITTRTIYSNRLPMFMLFGTYDEVTDRELSLLEVPYLATDNFIEMYCLFRNCHNLISVNASKWNVSNVINMSHVFDNCINLTTIGDVSNWTTSNVNNMNNMFNNCNKLTSLNVSNWDTSKVTGIENMFRECDQLTSLDVSNWDTNKIYNMKNAFYGCNSLTTIVGIGNWTTDKVNNTQATFCGCNKLTSLDLSNWDTSNVTDMSQMFDGCQILTELNISNWDTKNVTTMSHMFLNCRALTILDVNDWNISKVTNMQQMFNNCLSLTDIYVSNWDTSKVTNMQAMFANCNKLIGLDVSKWDISQVISMYQIFYNCKALTTLDVSSWNTSKVTNMYQMFTECTSLVSLNVSNWDTSNVTDMEGVFFFCKNLTSLDVGNWDMTKVTRTANMFNECNNLTSLNTDKWSIPKVADAESMFRRCYKLKKICLENAVSLTNIKNIFADDGSLSELKINGMNLNKITNDTTAFYACNDLNYVSMNNSDYNSINKIIEALPTRTTENPGALDIAGVDDLSQVNIEAAQTKYWNVSDKKLVARYTFDRATAYNVLPEVNDGFKYTYKDIATDYGFITREIYKNTTSDVDIVDCKIYDFGRYSGTTNKLSQPIMINNEIIFTHDVWDGCYINLHKYEGKEVTVSFDIVTKLNRWCELDTGIYSNDEKYFYEMFLGETVNEENKIVSYNKTFIVPTNAEFELAGMNIELINIQILCDGDNLFPKHMMTNKYEYSSSKNIHYNHPCYYDNKLVYSHSWNDVFLDVSQYDNKEITISFDVSIIEDAEHGRHLELRLEGASEYIDGWYNISESFSYNETVTINGHSDHLYIGGAGVELSNISMIVEDVLSEPLTKMKFGTNSSSNMSASLLEVSYLNTSNITDMANMFYNCHNLSSININNCDTSNVTDMSFMFYNCNKLTSLDVSKWDTGKVTDMSDMFNSCCSLTALDVSNWDTHNAIYMNGLFYGCTSLTSLDLSRWNVSKVENMSWMFSSYDDIDTMALTSVGDLSNWNTESLTTIAGMFYYCRHLTNLNVSNFDTSNVTDMAEAFIGCESLTSLDLSNWNTDNVVDYGLYEMFYDCFNLKTIGDISNWNTSKVVDMTGMFRGCFSLEQLDVSGFDTSQVTNMSFMFNACRSLKQLDVSNFDTSKVTNMTHMFNELYNVKELDVSNFDTSKVTNMFAMFGNGASMEKINISNFNMQSCLDSNMMFAHYNEHGNYNFKTVIMHNSDYNSINKVISELPTRTAENPGALRIGDMSKVNIDVDTAQSKFWNILEIKKHPVHKVAAGTRKIKNIFNQNKKVKIRIYKE